MEYQELKVEHDLVIVNRELWTKTKQQAMYNEAEVAQMAEDKYREYLRSNELTLNITFDRHPIVENIKFRLTETNFQKRSFNTPLNEQVAQSISDQIIDYVNTKYKGPVEKTKQLIADNTKQTLIDLNAKFSRGFFIGGIATAIAITLGAAICAIF